MLPLQTILDKINPLDKGGNEVPAEFYLSLIISNKKIKSAIWNINEEAEKNITYGSCESWGGESAEELIVAADASIANAVNKLSSVTDKQPTRVILGLPENWVEGSKVVRGKMDILEEVCRKLLLKPLGFVVVPEAMAHFLKVKEGGQPSAILVSLEDTELVVSLISQGKYLGSKIVGRSNNLALDLEEGLLRFDFQGVLPSRILLLNGNGEEDLSEGKRNLVAYHWTDPDNQNKLNFLQLPKVEEVGLDFEVNAVVNAGCRELGMKSAPKPAPEPLPTLETKPKAEEEETKEETAVEEGVWQESWPVEDFGFVKGEDIMLTGEVEEEIKEGTAEPEEKEPEPVSLSRKRFRFPSVLGRVKIPLAFPKFLRFPRIGFHFPAAKALFFAGAGVLVFGLGIFSFWQWAKAEAVIFVQPQRIEKEFEFTASAKVQKVDAEEMIIPVRKLIVEVSGEKSAGVTGKKIVGEKASGEAVIYNRTDEPKTFAQGVVLKGPGGLKFTLNQEVQVASKTADLENGVDKWGEARVPVTAANIGAQYNLAADSVMSFDNYSSSSFLVKNSSAFSGGTSREIQAVSKEDRSTLQKSILADLKEIALGQAEAQLATGDQLLPDSMELEEKADRFDYEVDEEASSLSLETEASFSVSYLENEDFEVLARRVVSELIDEGFEETEVSGESSFSVIDSKKGTYLAKLQQEFLPIIDLEGVAERLRGKTVNAGGQALSQLDHVGGMEVRIHPRIFSYLKFFPLKKESIIVSLERL